MTLALRVDPSSPEAPYEQLRRQVVEHVAAGRLAEGTRMPPVRQLAGDLGLAAGTVARAYRELEGAGIVRTRRGGGTTIAPGARGAAGAADTEDHVEQRLTDAIGAARAAGWTTERILRAVDIALGASR